VNRLSNRRAIVTGGGSGIGRASAVRFAQEGAHVFVVGRTADTLDETVETIKKAGGSASRFVADVTVDESVGEAVARCVRDHGGLEIFYANAGCTEKTV
jgi:NAD(P)-dependent dehydrogenase (short-subunit alcohol dehydrogenase family)